MVSIKGIIALCLLILLSGCAEEKEISASLDGEELSVQYCGSCHALPNPESLPKSLWETTILPRMGNRLGIYSATHSRAAALALDPVANNVGLAAHYPEAPVLSTEAWDAIQAYYLENAPEKLENKPLKMGAETTIFQPRFPNVFFSPPAGTLVQLLGGKRGLVYGDANKKQLVAFDMQLNPRGALEVGEGATAFKTDAKGRSFFSVIGSFTPTDAALGSVWEMAADGRSRMVIGKLSRPADLQMADLDADGNTELIVAEYGKERGRLAYWTEENPGQWMPTILAQRSGAVTGIPVDLDKDGRLDIVSLFGQSDEKVVLYQQDSAGKFQPRTLLQFPPSNGSSSLGTIDWNGDGLTDLIYTAGDNADYRPILKPYHGVYIFTQQAGLTFKQTLFLPLPGAYASEVADFDLDGDLDIVAISFFPDFNLQPEQSIVFFEQTATADFTPHPLPAANRGRWLRLSAADWDGDGDQDIAASSLAFETIPDKGQVAAWVKEGLPFIVWENQTH